jgi:Acetyltransferase (GNAT) family
LLHRSGLRCIGKQLILALARRCVTEDLARLQWSVLDWNTSAIGFYESLGANLSPEWVGCRLEGDAIARLAQSR